MLEYRVLIDKAREFGDEYCLKALSLITGQNAEIEIPRYQVYYTYFSWLLETATNCKGKDTMYCTHIGSFDDWRGGSSLYPYLLEQIRVVRANKLIIKRLVVLTKDEKEIGMGGLSPLLRKMTGAGIKVYLSTVKMLPKKWKVGIPKRDSLNWAIYERGKCPLLLQYRVKQNFTLPPNEQYVTAISTKQDILQKKRKEFEDIINTTSKCTLVTEGNEEHAIEQVFYSSGWDA